MIIITIIILRTVHTTDIPLVSQPTHLPNGSLFCWSRRCSLTFTPPRSTTDTLTFGSFIYTYIIIISCCSLPMMMMYGGRLQSLTLYSVFSNVGCRLHYYIIAPSSSSQWWDSSAFGLRLLRYCCCTILRIPTINRRRCFSTSDEKWWYCSFLKQSV